MQAQCGVREGIGAPAGPVGSEGVLCAQPGTREVIRSLLDTQVQCVLSTVHEGKPSQHLMAYAHAPSLQEIYLVTRRGTNKASNMLLHPMASLLWDNRTGNTADHRGGLALMAQGSAQLLNGWLGARARHLLRLRNPELMPLLQEETSVVFSVRVETYQVALGYGGVETYIPGGDPDCFGVAYPLPAQKRRPPVSMV